MNIYKKRTPTYIYRKIYEQHYGPTPREGNGRRYHIHHKDGNHSNNDPSNLVAVTAKEHYDIHYSQGDFGAAAYIARELNMSPEEKSDLARKNALARVEEGTHNFQNSKWQIEKTRKRLEEGTHPFQIRKDGTSVSGDKVKAGIHHLQQKGDSHPAAKTEILTFIYKDGTIEKCSRSELRQKYPYIDKRNLGSMISGRVKSCYG